MLLRQAMLVDKFSKRAVKRGRAYLMEGYVFNISVEAEGGGLSSSSSTSFLRVSASCFSSYRKMLKHAVEIRMKGYPYFALLKCSCRCEAGEGERCSHVCRLLFYLLAHAAFLTSS